MEVQQHHVHHFQQQEEDEKQHRNTPTIECQIQDTVGTMTTSSVAKKVTQSQDRVFCQGQMHILRQENLGANKSINDFFKITKICLHLFWPISRACSIKYPFQSTPLFKTAICANKLQLPP